MNIQKIGMFLWKAMLYSQRVLMIIAVIGTTLLVFVPMLTREFGRPFAGYEEFLLVFAFWMYMMGSSHGSYEKSQITADILSRVLKGRARVYLNLTATILNFVLCLIFMYWAFALVQWTLSIGARSPIHRIPIVYSQFSIFLGLLLSSIYNLVYTIRDIRDAFFRPVPIDDKKDVQAIE